MEDSPRGGRIAARAQHLYVDETSDQEQQSHDEHEADQAHSSLEGAAGPTPVRGRRGA